MARPRRPPESDMELLGLELSDYEKEVLRLVSAGKLPKVLLTRQELKRAYGLCKAKDRHGKTT